MAAGQEGRPGYFLASHRPSLVPARDPSGAKVIY